jgi:hypothetical protein
VDYAGRAQAAIAGHAVYFVVLTGLLLQWHYGIGQVFRDVLRPIEDTVDVMLKVCQLPPRLIYFTAAGAANFPNSHFQKKDTMGEEWAIHVHFSLIWKKYFFVSSAGAGEASGIGSRSGHSRWPRAVAPSHHRLASGPSGPPLPHILGLLKAKNRGTVVALRQ